MKGKNNRIFRYLKRRRVVSALCLKGKNNVIANLVVDVRVVSALCLKGKNNMSHLRASSETL